jgi:hypothetical protein
MHVKVGHGPSVFSVTVFANQYALIYPISALVEMGRYSALAGEVCGVLEQEGSRS